MRTLQVIALLAFATACFSMKMTVSKDIENMDTDMGDVLSALMQASEIDESKEVVALITNVKRQTDDEHDTLVKDFAAIKATFLREKKRLEDRIADLKKQIAAKEAEKARKEEQIRETKDAIAKAEHAIAQARADIIAENKRYDADCKVNLKKISDMKQGIDACTDALKILKDFEGKDLGSTQQITKVKGAFVQMASSLKHTLGKVRDVVREHSSEPIFVTMIEVFLEAAAAGVNDDLVHKIEHMIIDLRTQLGNDIHATEKYLAGERVKHLSLISKLNGIISTNEALLAHLRPLLKQYEEDLVRIEKELAALRKALKTAQDALAALIAEFKRQEKRYKTIIHRLEGDSKACSVALTYLRAAFYAGNEHNLNQ